MVREMLAALIEGRADHAAATLDPAVRAALDDLEPALDYGLLGLQAHAALFSLWPMMGRTYDRLEQIVQTWLPTAAGGPVAALQTRLMAHRATLTRATYLGSEQWRMGREAAYADMFRNCGRGVLGNVGTPALDVLIAPAWSGKDRETEAALQDMLLRRLRLDGPPADSFAHRLAATIMDFLLRQQAILRTAATVQAQVNRALGRTAPLRLFDARDIEVHNQLHGAGSDRLPYLTGELAALLGLRIHLDTDRLAITESEVAA